MFLLGSLVLFISPVFVQSAKTSLVVNNYFLHTYNDSHKYVDKSLLIKAVFEGPKDVVITAPPLFGKTTNLDMLMTFLSLNNTRCNVTRQLFENLKIFKERKFFDENFTKHLVVNVNFYSSCFIHNRETAVFSYQEEIHRLFYQYQYVCDSTKLNPKEREHCSTWSDVNNYLPMSSSDVKVGLLNLTNYLRKHHGKKVTVLINDFDSVITQSLYETEDWDTMDLILKYTKEMYSGLYNNKDIERTVLSGTSYMAARALLKPEYVHFYNFLGSHHLVGFYGLRKSEVDELVRKFNVSDQQVKDLHVHYGAYTSTKGIDIYNTYSVLKFLANPNDGIINYWISENTEDIGDVEDRTDIIDGLLAYQFVEEKVKKMMGNECMAIEHIKNVAFSHFKMMRKIIIDRPQNVAVEKFEPIYFHFLFENGWLSYCGKNNAFFKIPNREIESQFSRYLVQAIVDRFYLEYPDVDKCAKFFKDNFKMEPYVAGPVFSKHLDSFYINLHAVLRQAKSEKKRYTFNNLDLEDILFVVITHMGDFYKKGQLRYDSDGSGSNSSVYIDAYLQKEAFAVLIEVHCKETGNPDSIIPLRKMLVGNYIGLFENIEFTKQKVQRFLLIGIAVNGKGDLSISCLVNNTDISQAVTECRIL